MACACSTATSPTSWSGEALRVDFYHLTAGPLERTLPRLVERIVADGGRALIVAAEAERRAALDRLLWSYAPASFLPHAQAGDDADAEQPVLIGDAPVTVNGARNVLLVDGIWRDEALGFDRAFHLFDEDAIVAARAAWRGLAAHPAVERFYWRQGDDGRWEQVA